MIALIILFYSIKLYINYIILCFIYIFKILAEGIAEAWKHQKKKKKLISETFLTCALF